MRGRNVPTGAVGSKEAMRPQERRSENQHEHHREDEDRHRQQHLHWSLLRPFFCMNLSSMPQVARLRAQDSAERRSELIRRKHRIRKCDRVVGSDAGAKFRIALLRLSPTRSSVSTRRISSPSGPSLTSERYVTAASKLMPASMMRRQLVDEVRKLHVDLLGATRRSPTEQEAREQNPGGGEAEPKQESSDSMSHEKAENEPEDRHSYA